MEHVARQRVFAPVAPPTAHQMEKHEQISDRDTDASSQTAMDVAASEVSSYETETENIVDCGYRTDDDMCHPVYYMAIPPQVATPTFIQALPTIPPSPMSVNSSSNLPRKTSDAFMSNVSRNTSEMSLTKVLQGSKKSGALSAFSAVPIAQAPSPIATPPQSADKRKEPELAESECTTVMLKNLPKGLSRTMLLELLEQKGFARQCNFVYLPVEFTRRSCMGYAFVNFEHASMVSEFWNAFEGLTDWPVSSSKICKVAWSSPLQGLSEHVQRFRNSPLMHPSVPDECRPILLREGERLTFPSATKTLRAPRPRASRSMCPFWQGEMGDADTEA